MSEMRRDEMRDTKMSSGAQVVTSIEPVGAPVKQIPFGDDNQKSKSDGAKMTLAEVRAKLDGKSGKRFWKNLDELADTPAFQELMQEEFPRQAGAGEWTNPVSRRGFMKV